MPRTSLISRKTHETDIQAALNLDGVGAASIETGVGFFDHMLELLARHGRIDLTVKAVGDLKVDAHHTVEDVGLVIGQCLDQALGEKRGITRYGAASVPMDESLANVALDLSGRAVLVFNAPFRGSLIGAFPVELVEEFFKSIATAGKMNLHVNVPYGTNNHHVAEAIFKGFARALRYAAAIDPRLGDEVPSTKGTLS